MAQSKIGICNIALAMLGADAIRTFDENNKRSRMADVFYESTRDWLLSKFDWPFARTLLKLQPIDPETITSPPGYYPYQLPNDCSTPRDIHPEGSQDPWEIMGLTLFCKIPQTGERDVLLYYTKKEVDVRVFSSTFSLILALGIALRMGPSITQDKELMNRLTSQFAQEQRDAWEADANIGNTYREYDEDPNSDTFVNPSGWIADENYGTPAE